MIQRTERSMVEQGSCKNCMDDNHSKLHLHSILFDIWRESSFLIVFWALLRVSCSCGVQAFDYFFVFVLHYSWYFFFPARYTGVLWSQVEWAIRTWAITSWTICNNGKERHSLTDIVVLLILKSQFFIPFKLVSSNIINDHAQIIANTINSKLVMH